MRRHLGSLKYIQSLKPFYLGFPGGAVVGSPPAGARDAGSGPGPGGSHVLRSGWARAPQLPSLCSGARGPQLLNPRAAAAEACAPRACAPQRGRPPQ